MAEEYYKTKESVKEYIELAKEVNSSEIILKMKLFLPQGSSVLELGSGPGTDWEILSQDFNVTGSDFSDEFLQHLTSRYSNGNFLNLDAVSLETDQKFDAIYANKVLHHLSDQELISSISNQVKVLNENGLVCFTFWKFLSPPIDMARW